MQLIDSFNSIKVRLKHPDFRHQISTIMFQFHKGAIKTNRSLAIPSLKYCFNSIKVRLKHQGGIESPKKVMFQFHKGAIKTARNHEVADSVLVSIP